VTPQSPQTTSRARAGDAPRRRRSSLGVKLLAVALACLVANGVFIAIYFPSRYETDAMAALRTKAGSLAQVLAVSLAPALDFDDEEGTRAPLAGLARVPEAAYGRVIGIDGRTVAEYVRPGEREDTLRPAGRDKHDHGIAVVTEEIVSPLGRPLGRLEIGYSSSIVHTDADRYRGTILLVTLLLVAANAAAMIVVSRRIVRPLRRLSEAARRIAGGELEQRLDAPADDEVGELTESFNTMTERLVESRRLVEQYTEGLEALVAKRTEELSRKNDELSLQTQRAEEANRLKSEFLANMSHELRTPLSSIIGFLALILEGICDEEEERMELLRDAHQSSLHLLSLINYVLDLAKIEAGRLEIVHDRVDLAHEFAEVEKLLSVQAKTKMIELRMRIDPGLPDAYADTERVRQVLINLAGNAIKFTPEGSVTVRAMRHPDRSAILVEVVDTGIGIAREKQERLFQKFVQADGSRTRRYGGTGLGLALSKSLVELMDGEVGLESDGEGRGTRVWFTLPIAETAEDAERVVWSVDPTAPLVLVVEDDPAFARFLGRVLRSGGYRALVARTADEGYRIASQSRPVAITVDLGLPYGPESTLHTGFDLIERLAEEDSDARILVITGNADVPAEGLVPRKARHAPYPVIRKPADADEILRHLEKLPQPPIGASRTILVADDAPAMATIVERTIRNENMRLLTATNGVEAVRAIQASRPPVDLLLLDLDMPELDGFGVLREIARMDPARRPEVLVLTNYPELATGPESALLREGYVWGILPKSRLGDDPEMLKRALARIARKEQVEYATHPPR
jgi:signal transduction histidine kinase/CheY-like chemotaxis protein